MTMSKDKLTPKERLKIPRQPMPQQPVKERIKNFKEVPLGFQPEQAIREAQRCLQCKNPTCIKGCPVLIDIPYFIGLIAEGKFIEAVKKIKETNSLPAICGRVCPQENQCEKYCVLAKGGSPVAIGRLERFVADYERSRGEVEIPVIQSPKHKRIAVVGAGPAGLTVAGDLAKLGYEVTIFEALHKPGGVLVYGIPEFRLPKAIVEAEIDYLKAMGVKIELDCVVGKTYTVSEMFKDKYSAVFIGTGAGYPSFQNIPGENLCGILSANEFLTRSNLMKAYLFPKYATPLPRAKRVGVIGAGNVAMDSARTAVRLGAEETFIIYRRSRQEMPARIEEIERAEEEGVKFYLLTNPVQYIGDEKGWVKEAVCIKMRLGEPDASGRAKPIPVEGSEFTIPLDLVVVAIGTRANPIVPATTPGLKVNKWGYIEVNPQTMATSLPGIYAGGDIVTGSATVIEAMGAGKIAAFSIDKYLSNI